MEKMENDEWSSGWEMFSLIESVWHGKQYYFLQDYGLVYSRKSHMTMTKDDALDEFLKEIEWDGND